MSVGGDPAAQPPSQQAVLAGARLLGYAADVERALQTRLVFPGSEGSSASFRVKWTVPRQKMETLETPPKADSACDESIIAVYDRLMAAVRGFPGCVRWEWSPMRQRIAAAMLEVFRMRLVDITLREHVLLLYIICI